MLHSHQQSSHAVVCMTWQPYSSISYQAMHTWLALDGMTLVHGKEVNRRCSKAGLLSHAATSSPLPSITPLYRLAKAGLQGTQFISDVHKTCITDVNNSKFCYKSCVSCEKGMACCMNSTIPTNSATVDKSQAA